MMKLSNDAQPTVDECQLTKVPKVRKSNLYVSNKIQRLASPVSRQQAV